MSGSVNQDGNWMTKIILHRKFLLYLRDFVWEFCFAICNMESERVILSIAALLVLTIAIRKVRRSRLIALQMYFLRERRQQERMTALLCATSSTDSAETETTLAAAKTNGVGISQTTRLVWSYVSKPSLFYLVEKRFSSFKGVFLGIAERTETSPSALNGKSTGNCGSTPLKLNSGNTMSGLPKRKGPCCNWWSSAKPAGGIIKRRCGKLKIRI